VSATRPRPVGNQAPSLYHYSVETKGSVHVKMDTLTILLIGAVIVSAAFLFLKTRKNSSSTPQAQVYVLFGGPGSGKGTVAGRLVNEYNFHHISTGNMFRDNIKNQTELGKKVSELIQAGALVPDEITLAMVQDALVQALNNKKTAILLDGFPRTAQQTKALIDMIKNGSLKGVELKVIYMHVPSADMLLDRLTSRLTCSNPACQATYSIKTLTDEEKASMKCRACGGELKKRADDEVESIKKRIDTFTTTEKDITDIFDADKIVTYKLDATQSIPQVYDDFVAQVGLKK